MTKKYEVPRNNVDLKKVLGEGHFGQVWKAEVWRLGDNPGTTVVAVKSLKGMFRFVLMLKFRQHGRFANQHKVDFCSF